jgi:hypothetical protein
MSGPRTEGEWEKCDETCNPFESFGIQDLQMISILWKARGNYANTTSKLVSAPNKNGHYTSFCRAIFTKVIIWRYSPHGTSISTWCKHLFVESCIYEESNSAAETCWLTLLLTYPRRIGDRIQWGQQKGKRLEELHYHQFRLGSSRFENRWVTRLHTLERPNTEMNISCNMWRQ